MQHIIEFVNIVLFSIGVSLLTYRKDSPFDEGPLDQLCRPASIAKTMKTQREWMMHVAMSSKLFQPFISLWHRLGVEQREREIYEGISYLRNLIFVGNGYEMNGDYVLEELAQLGGSMQPFYIQLLHFLRSNERELGLNRFITGVGAQSAGEYGRILMQWDEVKPESLAEMLLLYQCSIQERRVTLRKHRDEVLSDLIYLPVVMNVMVLLINFIYVAYFLDQKRMLLMMFQ